MQVCSSDTLSVSETHAALCNMWGSQNQIHGGLLPVRWNTMKNGEIRWKTVKYDEMANTAKCDKKNFCLTMKNGQIRWMKMFYGDRLDDVFPVFHRHCQTISEIEAWQPWNAVEYDELRCFTVINWRCIPRIWPSPSDIQSFVTWRWNTIVNGRIRWYHRHQFLWV